jgi:hypothetical protein
MKHVTPVHDEVYLPSQGRCQGDPMVREEIVAPAPPFHAGPKREIESQVGVCQEQYAYGLWRSGHPIPLL